MALGCPYCGSTNCTRKEKTDWGDLALKGLAALFDGTVAAVTNNTNYSYLSNGSVSNLVPDSKNHEYYYKCNRCGKETKSLVDVSSIKSHYSSDITIKVRSIISDQVGEDLSKITLSSNIYNDLGADSLDAVEILMKIEKEFSITIPDDVAEKITTVGDAVDFVNRCA